SGRRGASWLVGSSCPLLPVDSDSLGPRLERLLMSFSRIQSRIVRFVTHAQPWSQTSGAFAPDSVHRRWQPDLDFIPGERVGGDRPIGWRPPRLLRCIASARNAFGHSFPAKMAPICPLLARVINSQQAGICVSAVMSASCQYSREFPHPERRG